MDKSIIDGLKGDVTASKSPLAMLGINDDGPSLLDEKLSQSAEGNRNGFPGSKDFSEAKRESHSLFEKLKDNSEKSFSADLPGFGDESNSESNADPEPKDEPTEEPGKQEEIPDWWHSVNDQQVQLRRRQEAHEQQVQQTNDLLQRLYQKQNEGAQPQPDVDYESLGFGSAREYQEYEQALSARIRGEVSAAQAPLFAQIAYKNFETAMARAQAEHENFDKYFSKEKLNNYYKKLSEQIPPQQMVNINWEAEWGNAFKASDYDRVKREYQALLDKQKALADNKEQDRQEQKKNLKVVPKASHQGATARGGLQSDLDKLSPKLDMRSFGREFKRLSSLG